MTGASLIACFRQLHLVLLNIFTFYFTVGDMSQNVIFTRLDPAWIELIDDFKCYSSSKQRQTDGKTFTE